jgi:hypothetical protein
MKLKKLTTAFALLFIVCFTAQAQTTTTVYIGNSTSNTYYISFYNTATSQYYYETLNPWTTPTPVLPVGTYNITVTSDGNAYPTWMYFVQYMTYGTWGYFQNVYLGSPWVTVGFGD